MMSEEKHGMLKAAQSDTLLGAALAYVEAGCSVLPVKGKKPALPAWSNLQLVRPAHSHLHNWDKRGLLQGVGVICGAVSRNLVVIDLDGDDSVLTFCEAFPQLLNTFTVRSGSGHGLHIYLRAQTLPATTRAKGYELRANGCYVVAPPSLHPETKAPYIVANPAPVMLVVHLNKVTEWIRSKIPTPQAPHWIQPPALPRLGVTGTFEANAKRFYFNRAVEGEVFRVCSATEGARNDTLFKAARKLGQLVHQGLGISEIQEALLAASHKVGLPTHEARATISSGIRYGMRTPRQVPESR